MDFCKIYLKLLLKAVQELLKENVKIKIFDLEGIELFNQDLENEPNDKQKIFKEKIKEADGLLIVTY